MANENKATVKIQSEFDDKGIKAAKQGLKDVTAETKKAEQATAANTEATSKFSLKAIAAWSAVALSVKQVVKFAWESIQAHLNNARSVKTLEESYKALGITGSTALKNAKAFATEMQNATGIADETFLNAQRMLANFGVVGQKAQESIKAAYALSVGRNMDFAAALDLVTKAAAGQTQTLKRYGIQVAENVSEGQKFDSVLKDINDKFGAAAQAQMGDQITQIESLKQKWGDFKEVIGEWLIPAFELLIKVGSEAVDILNKVFGNDQTALEQSIAQDKQRLELLNKQYMMAQQIYNTNQNDARIREVQAEKMKKLENEMRLVSDAIRENQKTINNEKAETAKKEEEINARTFEIAKNELASQAAAKAKKEALENQNNALKEQQSIIADMGLKANKPTEQTSSWGDTSGKLNTDADFIKAQENLDAMLELKRQYLENTITDEQLKNEALLNLDRQYLEQVNALEEQQAEASKNREISTAANRKRTQQKAVNDLISLQSSSNKTMSAIGKTAAVATATIDTYKAANAAYSAMAGIPVVGPALGAAAAAAAIAAGLNNVAQISNIQLAKGGLVKAVTGGVPAVIGEGGSDEAVLPLNNQNVLSRIGAAIADSTASGDNVNNAVNININVAATGGLQAFLSELTEATRNGTTEALQYANIAAKAGAKESRYSV